MTDNQETRPNRALRVAVTGGAGSGKSAVCSAFEALGAFVVDLDCLSREAVAAGTAGFERVVERFGRQVVAADGGLDRRRLRKIIVSDPEARRDLEAIVHPEVLRQMNRRMAEAEARGAQLFVAEVPLLFEAGLETFFDRVVVVGAPEKERVRRLVDRDKVAPEQAQALIGVQMPESEKKNRADFVIENSGRRDQLICAVEKLYRRLAASPEKDGETA